MCDVNTQTVHRSYVVHCNTPHQSSSDTLNYGKVTAEWSQILELQIVLLIFKMLDSLKKFIIVAIA